jgi:hypothetical protein
MDLSEFGAIAQNEQERRVHSALGKIDSIRSQARESSRLQAGPLRYEAWEKVVNEFTALILNEGPGLLQNNIPGAFDPDSGRLCGMFWLEYGVLLLRGDRLSRSNT